MANLLPTSLNDRNLLLSQNERRAIWINCEVLCIFQFHSANLQQLSLSYILINAVSELI